MKSKIVKLLALYALLTGFAIAAEKKVDADGNEYFLVTSDEIEAKNKKPPIEVSGEPPELKPRERSYRQLALELKPGCIATGEIGKAGAAVVPLDDFLVVIPLRPNGLPRHPGEDGKLTMHGVDSDNDCVRDDIEHFIFSRFKEEGQQEIRKYLSQYAIWLDFFLIAGLTELSAKTADTEMGEAGQCLIDILGYSKARAAIDALFAEFHNTFPRSERYIENSKNIGGWTRREIPKANCS